MYKKIISVMLVVVIVAFALPVFATPILKTPDKPVLLMSPLIITSPHTGNSWPANSGNMIKWTYDPARFQSTTVKILLLKGGTVIKTISAWNTVGLNGNGQAPPAVFDEVPTGSDYQVKIIGLDAHRQETKQCAISGYFSITEASKVTVTAPNGNQPLKPGQQVTISWNYSGDVGKTCNIIVWDGKVSINGIMTINSNAPTGYGRHGSCTWLVPDTLPTGMYRININGISPYNYTAVSAWFKINNPKLP